MRLCFVSQIEVASIRSNSNEAILSNDKGDAPAGECHFSNFHNEEFEAGNPSQRRDLGHKHMQPRKDL